MKRKGKPTNQLTREFFESLKYEVGLVERFNPYSGWKTDLFGIIDFIAINEKTLLGIQSCGSDFSAHILKMLLHERASTKLWLKRPKRYLILIGWTKRKHPGSKKTIKEGAMMVHTPRIAIFTFNKNKLTYYEINKSDFILLANNNFSKATKNNS